MVRYMYTFVCFCTWSFSVVDCCRSYLCWALRQPHCHCLVISIFSSLETVSFQLMRDSSAFVHSSLPARPNHGTCLQPNFMFICYCAAFPNVYQDRLFQACFSIFSTDCLELTAISSSDQQLCLFLNLDLKLSIHSGFHRTTVRPVASACEVTTKCGAI